jgi:hypothetical protein
VIEFRKRISWYARHLHPCNQLRQEMRLFDAGAQVTEQDAVLEPVG